MRPYNFTKTQIFKGGRLYIQSMFFSLFLIALKQSNVKASVTGTFVRLESFGYEVNGQYSLSILQSSQPIIFGVLTKSQYDKLSNIGDEQGKYCPSNVSDPESTPEAEISSIQLYFQEGSEPMTLSGKVKEKGVYYFFLYSCGSSKYNMRFSIELSNPNSKLDTREYPSKIEDPVAIAAFAILLILWVINWVMNCRLKIFLHFLLSAVFILALLAVISRYVVLLYSAQHHKKRSVETLFIIFDLFYMLCLFVFVLLAAKGWCIVRESIKFTELLIAIICTLAFLILQTINNYVSFGKYDFIVIILMLVALIVYVQQLISAINNATLHIRAHLLAITNVGIDARTTPIWQKFLMYQMLQWTIIVFCLILIVRIIVVYFLSDLIWLPVFLGDVQNLVMLILLGINFRLRGPAASNGYAMIEDQDMSSYGPTEVIMSDIENMGINEMQMGGKQWESGMPLPGPPHLVETPKIVTLESPDGTREIAISPGSYDEPPQ